MSDERVIYSEPAVTRKAKDFLKNNSGSADYKEAADKAVADVVSAISERIKRAIASNYDHDESSKEQKSP